MSSWRSLSRNRDFRTLWVGETINALGSRTSMFVLPLVTFALTGSALVAAVVEGLHLVGMVGALLPAGALVDRLDRRRVMLLASSSGAVLYASLALAAALGHLTVVHLALVAAGTGVGAGVYSPAESSAVRDVVSTEELPTALSQNQAREQVAMLLGAPLGGVMYALGRAVPFAFDAVTFVASAVSVGRLRTDLSAHVEDRPDRPRVRDDVTAGLRFVLGQPLFRVLLAWSSMANLRLNALFFTVTLRMVAEGYAPAQIGLVDTAAGVGGVLGAVAAPWLIDRVPTGRLTVVIAWSLVLPLLPLVVRVDPLVAGGGLFAVMLLNPAGNAGIGAYRMAVTPASLQGRVVSASQFVSWSVLPLAPLVGGVLLQQVGGVAATVVLLGATVTGAVLVSLSSTVRSVPRPAQWPRATALAA